MLEFFKQRGGEREIVNYISKLREILGLIREMIGAAG